MLRIGFFDLQQLVAKDQQGVSWAQFAGRAVVLCVIKDSEPVRTA
jgi:hypothetical protein